MNGAVRVTEMERALLRIAAAEGGIAYSGASTDSLLAKELIVVKRRADRRERNLFVSTPLGELVLREGRSS